MYLLWIAFTSFLVVPALAFIECNVLNYGAVADNKTDIGPAILKTWQSCVQGQTTITASDVLLYIPSGNFLLASNVLMDDAANFEFHIAGSLYMPFNSALTGTMIEFEVRCSSFIINFAMKRSQNCNNIVFNGPGAIYGNGYRYRPNGDVGLAWFSPLCLQFSQGAISSPCTPTAPAFCVSRTVISTSAPPLLGPET
jgi:rhamnogalacturonan hydrolase